MPDDDAATLLSAIRTTIRLARIAQQACEEAGLNLAQYRALTSAGGAGRRASELANATSVSRPALTSLMKGMERSGLIAREVVDDDGRGVRFVATPLGAQRLRHAELLLVERFTDMLGNARAALEALSTAPLDEALDSQADREFGGRA